MNGVTWSRASNACLYAHADGLVLGRGGKLPWQKPYGPGLPLEMQHFLDTTANSTIIVGRRTFEEAGACYPHAAHTIVVSRDADGKLQDAGATVATSVPQAIQLANAFSASSEQPSVWVCGGHRVYAECMEQHLAQELWLTLIDHEFEGMHDPLPLAFNSSMICARHCSCLASVSTDVALAMKRQVHYFMIVSF